MHHVTGKSPSGRLLFHDDVDRQRYLQFVAREVREREWRVLTFCLLGNHLHLLVQTPCPDLSAGFKRVHEQFARHINRRRGEGGHVFGDRFYSGPVRTHRHVLGCLRYIARNPIEAGICRHPHDWPWSAHRALAGTAEPPAFLDVAAAYEHLGSYRGEARLNYLQLVAKSTDGLLADLAHSNSDAWLIAAVDDFSIPIGEIAQFLKISRTTAYERLAKARRTEGSVPSVRG